ncbi:hypothetical protein pdul_cds_392 [Pandoravirus dulcis]|uniref:Uncharacterized protein n=1 Tax=Pandoravirus dulcis TaxID=1349409 RepID=S4VQ70_9VIRU|nr:hypothetical protein pdul_cds_392 [Pandoravirus dulcis]AGO82432.1 hypothetical protein pdul_cds_392 [Pandoravirus dulcis]
MGHGGEYEMKSLDGSDPFQVPPTGPAATRPHRCQGCCTRNDVCCAVGVVSVFALSLLVAAIVFVPWFLVDIQPDIALEESMKPTTCLVTNHTVIDTNAVDGNTRLLYMPGLAVVVPIDPHKAVATARVERSKSWMSADVMTNYFAKHPINATSPCYTDGRQVAMEPGVDDIGRRLAFCISMTVVAFFSSLALSPFAVALVFVCIAP